MYGLSEVGRVWLAFGVGVAVGCFATILVVGIWTTIIDTLQKEK